VELVRATLHRVSTLRVEPGSETLLPTCPCCGGRTRVVRGVVYADDAPRAAYLVRWAPGRPQHDAEIAVSIGGWSGGESEADRRLVALRYRMLEGGPAFMVIDGQSSPWTSDAVLGRPLSRTEAMSSLAKEAFSVVDAVGAQDARVANWALQ
jgi:hypothetical protein